MKPNLKFKGNLNNVQISQDVPTMVVELFANFTTMEMKMAHDKDCDMSNMVPESIEGTIIWREKTKDDESIEKVIDNYVKQ